MRVDVSFWCSHAEASLFELTGLGRLQHPCRSAFYSVPPTQMHSDNSVGSFVCSLYGDRFGDSRCLSVLCGLLWWPFMECNHFCQSEQTMAKPVERVKQNHCGFSVIADKAPNYSLKEVISNYVTVIKPKLNDRHPYEEWMRLSARHQFPHWHHILNTVNIILQLSNSYFHEERKYR